MAILTITSPVFADEIETVEFGVNFKINKCVTLDLGQITYCEKEKPRYANISIPLSSGGCNGLGDCSHSGMFDFLERKDGYIFHYRYDVNKYENLNQPIEYEFRPRITIGKTTLDVSNFVLIVNQSGVLSDKVRLETQLKARTPENNGDVSYTLFLEVGPKNK